jgi:hypothetical protein
MLSLSCCAAGVSLRKFLPIPTNSRVFPTLSCINLRVWGLFDLTFSLGPGPLFLLASVSNFYWLKERLSTFFFFWHWNVLHFMILNAHDGRWSLVFISSCTWQEKFDHSMRLCRYLSIDLLINHLPRLPLSISVYLDCNGPWNTKE